MVEHVACGQFQLEQHQSSLKFYQVVVLVDHLVVIMTGVLVVKAVIIQQKPLENLRAILYQVVNIQFAQQEHLTAHAVAYVTVLHVTVAHRL
jgi:hypothetical protein